MALNTEQEKMIELLYREMYELLSAYAMNALRDRGIAEEAVQETFQIACDKAEKLEASPNRQGWIMNTLKYVINNTRRRRERLSELYVSLVTDIPDPANHNGEVDFKLQCAEILGEGNYELLEMVAIKKYSLLEAARETGISLEACKKRVQRAKKKLEEHLKTSA